MWKDRKFLIILLAELVLIFQFTLPYKFCHYHCNHTDSDTTEKHDDTSNDANKHCHFPNNFIHTKTKSLISNPKSSINDVLFVILFANITSIFNRVSFDNFPIKDSKIQLLFHSTRLSFRGPPSVA